MDYHGDQKRAEDDIQQGDFSSIEEETEKDSDENGIQGEAREKEPVGSYHKSEDVADKSNDSSYKGTEEHSAGCDGQGREADLKGRTQRDLEERQYDAEGDENSAEGNHRGFSHLLCGQLDSVHHFFQKNDLPYYW